MRMKCRERPVPRPTPNPTSLARWWLYLPRPKCKYMIVIKPQYGKCNKMTCAPSEDSDQPGHSASLISPLSAWRNLGSLVIQSVWCPGWPESSLGAHVILLVLSCSCSLSLTHSSPVDLRSSQLDKSICGVFCYFIFYIYTEISVFLTKNVDVDQISLSVSTLFHSVQFMGREILMG